MMLPILRSSSRLGVGALAAVGQRFPTGSARRGLCAAPAVEDVISEISYLDIRVGKVVKVVDHPSDAGLYIQKIQVTKSAGEDRTIVAGIRKFCSKEELLDSSVIVLCNLKPRVIRGVDSTGMVLCCSDVNKTTVKPIRPPTGCEPGTVVTFSGFKSLVSPDEPDLPSVSFNRINKAFSKVAPGLLVNENGIAVLKMSTPAPTKKLKGPAELTISAGEFTVVEFSTPDGPCTGPILNSTIS